MHACVCLYSSSYTVEVYTSIAGKTTPRLCIYTLHEHYIVVVHPPRQAIAAYDETRKLCITVEKEEKKREEEKKLEIIVVGKKGRLDQREREREREKFRFVGRDQGRSTHSLAA